jgi:hypothetical protein
MSAPPLEREVGPPYWRRTVDRWVNDKLIFHVKFGNRCRRFRWPAVERAVDRLTTKEAK